MLVEGNTLKGDWKSYLPRLVKQWVKEIPEERRNNLYEEILARFKLLGCEDECALKAALKHLKK